MPQLLDPHHLLDSFILSGVSSGQCTHLGQQGMVGTFVSCSPVSHSKKSCLVVSHLACLSGKLAHQGKEILASPSEPNQISCLGKVGAPTRALTWAATAKPVSVPPNWRRGHQIRSPLPPNQTPLPLNHPVPPSNRPLPCRTDLCCR